MPRKKMGTEIQELLDKPETLLQKQEAILAELLKAGAAAFDAGDAELATCYLQIFNMALRKWRVRNPSLRLGMEVSA